MPFVHTVKLSNKSGEETNWLCTVCVPSFQTSKSWHSCVNCSHCSSHVSCLCLKTLICFM
jgi:hypothetical protein